MYEPWYVSPAGSMVLASKGDGKDRIVCHLSLLDPAEAVRCGRIITAAPVLLAAVQARAESDAHVEGCHMCKSSYRLNCAKGRFLAQEADRLSALGLAISEGKEVAA